MIKKLKKAVSWLTGPVAAKAKKKVKSWIPKLDASAAKKRLADDARLWGNVILGLGILSIFVSEATFLAIVAKVFSLDIVPVIAVTHTWLVIATLSVGAAIRGLAFALDLKPEKPKRSKKPIPPASAP